MERTCTDLLKLNQDTKKKNTKKKWNVMNTAPGVLAEVKNKMCYAGLMVVACQIASSCSEYSLQDYCFLSISIDCYRFC